MGDESLARFLKVKGDHVVVSLNPGVYPLEAVYSSAYVFLDRAYVLLDEGKGRIIVRIRPKGVCDLERLGLDFCNELLSYSNYTASLKKNRDLIDRMMAAALLSADSSFAKGKGDAEKG